MKKALLYALTLALALLLTACGQPKAEQPTDSAPSTSVPEPIKDTTLGPEPEQTPAPPVETEDTQPPEETAKADRTHGACFPAARTARACRAADPAIWWRSATNTYRYPRPHPWLQSMGKR